MEEEGRDLKTQIFLSFLLYPLGIDQTQPEAKGAQAHKYDSHGLVFCSKEQTGGSRK